MFFTHIKTNKPKKDKNNGFTLVEVLVSMSLFAIVVTMSVGTLLVLIDTNSKQQNMQTVMTNLSFAMDSMTREIRTGYYYECHSSDALLTETNGAINRDCSNGESNFAFTESGGSLTGVSGQSGYTGSNRIAYRLQNNTIERRLGDSGTTGFDWHAITAPEVVIDSLEFVVTDTDPYPNLKAPTVTIFISGTAGNIARLDTSFALQTTVTQQILDL